MRRWSTRLACLYAKMIRRQPLRAIPLNCRALARDLGCSYQTVVRRTGELASAPAWFFQGYGCVIFERHRPHQVKPCAHPQFWLVSRFAVHRIGGRAGKVRARLRQKTPALWIAHLVRIKNLALGMIFKRRERANDKHHGSPDGNLAGPQKARPPPTANRAGLRRILIEAATLQAWYDALPAAPSIHLYGWLRNRLHEWHAPSEIMRCLRHAVTVLPAGRFRPDNAAAWVSGVAARHLDRDGLAPIQRRHALWACNRRKGRAIKVEKPEEIFIDNDGISWKHVGGTNWEKL